MNRRQWLRGAGGVLAGGSLAGLPLRAGAAPLAGAELEQQLRACTPPGDPVAALLEGNRRFAAVWQEIARLPTPQKRAARLAGLIRTTCQIDPLALAKGQQPWLALLTCADSRVSPQLLFHAGPGEIFEVACAGNTAFDEGIASLDYAVAVLGIRLILVMGHSGCGAVKAAMAREPLTPLLEELVQPIRATLVSGDSLSQAVQANARNTAAQLTARSTVLRDAVAAGRLSIHSAYFDIGSGRVSLL